MTRRKPQVVVPLHSAMPAHGVPNAGVVLFLEDILKQAKRGAVTGIGAFWIGPAEAVFKGWAPGTASQHDMVAGAAMLSFEINRAVIDA